MDIKRAVWISVLLYISTFIIGILLFILAGTEFTTTENISTTHWILSIVLSIILASLFSLWYFKGKKVKASALTGFHLGITFLVVGIILDLIFLIPSIFVGSSSEILAYYTDIWFYISIVLIVLTPVIVGAIKNR